MQQKCKPILLLFLPRSAIKLHFTQPWKLATRDLRRSHWGCSAPPTHGVRAFGSHGARVLRHGSSLLPRSRCFLDPAKLSVQTTHQTRTTQRVRNRRSQ
jgi:hypothetical protein